MADPESKHELHKQEAQMHDGVLTLRLPKSVPTRKRITVKAD